MSNNEISYDAPFGGDEPLVEEKKPAKASKVEVRSLWLSPIHNQVLLLSDSGKYAIVKDLDWQRKKLYKMDRSEFDALPQPEDFGGGLSREVIEALWRSGVVSRGNVIESVVGDVAMKLGEDKQAILSVIRSN